MYDRDLPSNGGTNDGSHQGEEEEPLHGGASFLPAKILLKNKNKKILEGTALLTVLSAVDQVRWRGRSTHRNLRR